MIHAGKEPRRNPRLAPNQLHRSRGSEKRLDLQKLQYKKIYNQRGDIVHGNETIKRYLTEQHTEAAIRISRKLLRACAGPASRMTDAGTPR